MPVPERSKLKKIKTFQMRQRCSTEQSTMMKALRCSVDEVHEEAVNVAGIWCVNTTFTEKRIWRAPRMYNEKATDQRLQDPVKPLSS